MLVVMITTYTSASPAMFIFLNSVSSAIFFRGKLIWCQSRCRRSSWVSFNWFLRSPLNLWFFDTGYCGKFFPSHFTVLSHLLHSSSFLPLSSASVLVSLTAILIPPLVQFLPDETDGGRVRVVENPWVARRPTTTVRHSQTGVLKSHYNKPYTPTSTVSQTTPRVACQAPQIINSALHMLYSNGGNVCPPSPVMILMRWKIRLNYVRLLMWHWDVYTIGSFDLRLKVELDTHGWT